MASDEAPPKKRHLRLLPPINGQPVSSRIPTSPPIFVPGRTYRNAKMDSVDFLVESVTTKAGLFQLAGKWINRKSKKFYSPVSTTVRVGFIIDWTLLPLSTHPRRKVEAPLLLIKDPWENPADEDPDCPPDLYTDEDGPDGA